MPDPGPTSEAPGPRVRWPEDLLKKHRLDEETARFLRTLGLPEYLPGMTLEFGIFDSDGPDLVIGEDVEGSPIYVDSESGAVFHAALMEPNRPYFINSSVRLLAHFVQRIVFDPAHGGEAWSENLLNELRAVDAPALQAWDTCMWPALIDRFQLDVE